MRDEEIDKLNSRLKERWRTQVFEHGDCRVEVLNAGGVKYTDSSRTVWVWGEVLTGDVAYVIDIKSMHYWGNKTAKVDAGVRQEIAQNIKEAFNAHGLLVDVE